MIFQILAALPEGTADAAAQAAPAVEKVSFSLIEMAFKGGWLMIPLFLLSILAVYLFGERWWAIRKASQIDENFMRNIHDYVHVT